MKRIFMGHLRTGFRNKKCCASLNGMLSFSCVKVHCILFVHPNQRQWSIVIHAEGDNVFVTSTLLRWKSRQTTGTLSPSDKPQPTKQAKWLLVEAGCSPTVSPNSAVIINSALYYNLLLSNFIIVTHQHEK